MDTEESLLKLDWTSTLSLKTINVVILTSTGESWAQRRTDELSKE